MAEKFREGKRWRKLKFCISTGGGGQRWKRCRKLNWYELLDIITSSAMMGWSEVRKCHELAWLSTIITWLSRDAKGVLYLDWRTQSSLSASMKGISNARSRITRNYTFLFRTSSRRVCHQNCEKQNSAMLLTFHNRLSRSSLPCLSRKDQKCWIFAQSWYLPTQIIITP